ncbi:M18 family aminopeptidase [Desulfosporosinus sp. BICA1-9]|uniref:M18 family aminopeptidase n=1 Tax=Desulfosporosinus sp. BICA1-9 TaxID=1531958 RepID=UPI00054C29A2|nr:M18 family aminopeptidase [Desulfosporosinus sp. BICA1-9]KJS48126.1 MAG: aminopeptidase [Peptococcaceae bacterium BRH_c23]KJS78408.1 MAG: aminopeptidase [Desulfosporosinus sp. BICA1-9]HBW36573.1 M18 family aminopeptidase [Desulfosporosinus sp.]
MTAFITDEERMFAQELLNFIDQSPSAFHAVQSVKKILIPQGFQELSLQDKWSLVPGGNYFVSRNNSALIAFTIGLGGLEDYGFHLIAAHTDSPSFRVKSIPEIQVEGRYLKLNVEAYGGPILNTWLDRPLSLAGRIILRGETPFNPQIKLYNSERPLLVIPNQSIHLNRKINEGIELNKQKDMLPLLSQISDDLQNDKRLVHHLAEILNCPVEEILYFDLFLFETIQGSFVGLQQEYLSSGRLDDLAMVHAGAWALAKSEPSLMTNVLACFDHEECGSTSKQGAASPFLSHVLERILLAQEKGREAYFQALAHSFLISADMAHALHPNAVEKHDPVNHPILNGGPVLKISANQSYTTDAETAAVFTTLCQNAQVPVQIFVNRSDERGGSTIGPISSTHLDIPAVDVGNPVLAMHSVRELGGVKDHLAIAKVFSKFYGTPNR